MTAPSAVRCSLGALLQPRSVPRLLSNNAAPRRSGPATVERAATFSTSAQLGKRKTRDSNRLRGVSTLRRTGPREPLSMSRVPLPKPVKELPPVRVDKDHGLWQFFHQKDQSIPSPQLAASHGRSWTADECRKKSWEDLHKLWWVCCKERNRIATARLDLERSDIGHGDWELKTRDEGVRRTQRAIKHVLTERYYAWEDAVELAKTDPEVNLSGNGDAYTPRDYFEQEEAEEIPGAELTPNNDHGPQSTTVAADAEASTTRPSAIDPSAVPVPKSSQEGPRV